MVESGAYLAYVSIYTASKVQKESIRTIFYFFAGFFFLAANAFSTSIWKSDNTFI